MNKYNVNISTEDTSPEEEKLLWGKKQKKERFKSILTDIFLVVLLLIVLVGIFFLIKWIFTTPLLAILSIFLKIIIGIILVCAIIGLFGGIMMGLQDE